MLVSPPVLLRIILLWLTAGLIGSFAAVVLTCLGLCMLLLFIEFVWFAVGLVCGVVGRSLKLEKRTNSKRMNIWKILEINDSN